VTIEVLAGKLLAVVGITVFALVCGLFFKGIDRIVAARMQSRIGPPLWQPYWDIQKLLLKETVVPENAIPWIFNGAPILALISAITILLYIPMGGVGPVLEGRGDLILILYLFTLPAVAMVAGGFASGSPYAAVGSQREMVTMMSYEFPLAAVVITLAWKLWAAYGAGTAGFYAFSLSAFADYPVWGSVGIVGGIGLLLTLLALLVVTPAELSKVPFDAPEAEEELAGGLLVEYSGRNLALFYLGEAVKTLVMSALIVALFFPYNLAPVLGMGGTGALVVDFVFFWVKTLVVMLVAVTYVRIALARLKVDQIAYLYWVPVLGLSLGGLALVVIDHFLF